jgi:UDP-glucuronate 4-epimerase
MSKALVTGAAGFIGYHLSKFLLEKDFEVIGIDNLNDYYDPELKRARLKILVEKKSFEFLRIDLVEENSINDLFKKNNFKYVVNLAAQAGVRYSLEAPRKYIQSNIDGFLNILEACRHYGTEHLIFASSSSVYGANVKLPFSENDNVDHPLSLYGATKKSNELMAHSYASLYGIPCTGLRFFTVYGPWGRPDMALFLFTKAIFEGKPIQVFNYGDMSRDFTYIDDIVEGIYHTMINPPAKDSSLIGKELPVSKSYAPYRILNIGNNKPEDLLEFIKLLEKAIGKKAEIKLMPMQPGDVKATFADLTEINKLFGFKPKTSIKEGIPEFVKWYREYYKV